MDESARNVPLSIQLVYVTKELQRRPQLKRDYARENLALRDIANQMISNPGQVLPKLVDLSMDLCHAVAGGISIYEEADQVFRWHHLRGTLERFNGSTTPQSVRRHSGPESAGARTKTGAGLFVAGRSRRLAARVLACASEHRH